MTRGAMREQDIESGALTWAQEHEQDNGARPDWRTVDRALRAIRHGRAALDAEEMHWLREAEALQIWRPLGMVSAIDYLERVLGYAPRTAQDRLRVARSLGALPKLTAALARGELAFSAVRELTRVVTPATEEAWLVSSRGKNLRQIEELVAHHRPGDGPEDPPDPEPRTHVVRFELAAETFALLRQTRNVLADEHGTSLDDDALVAALCSAVLDGAPASEPTGRAKFQIALTVCRRCQQGWQEGGGAQIAVGPAAVERAMCDAQHIGSIDSATPERAYQDITKSVARLVWRRDGGRCRVDGCRSSLGLELHHIVRRVDGGSHDALNLVLLCSGCHIAHHEGRLTISGTAKQLQVRRTAEEMFDDREPGIKASSIASSAMTGRVGAHAGARAMGPVSRVGAGVDLRNAERRDWQGVTECTAVAKTASAHGAGRHVHVDAPNQGTASRSVARSVTTELDAPAPDTRTTLDAAILRTQAKAALTSLGWKPAVASAAVATAASQGAAVTLERLIFESLRQCPKPVSAKPWSG